MKGHFCYYCGKLGYTVDHWPPQSVEALYPQIKGLLIRCCTRCNSILSNSMQNTLKERKWTMVLINIAREKILEEKLWMKALKRMARNEDAEIDVDEEIAKLTGEDS